MATFKNVVLANVSANFASPTSVLTAGASEILVVHSIYLGNQTAGTIPANVRVTSGAVTANVVFNADIPAKQSLILDKPLVLEANDILKIDGGSMSVVVSYLDVNG
jgi:hypothetical protein